MAHGGHPRLPDFPKVRAGPAPPVLVALDRTPQWSCQHHRRHKTPAHLLRQLVAVLVRWSGGRRFVLVGDGGFGSHEMAAFAHRHRHRLTRISRFGPDANLHEPPPPYGGKGRPRVKGAKLPAPKETVVATSPTKWNVAWYGGGRRDVAVVSGTGQWSKSGEGLVPLLWVFVHDLTRTHRDDSFFSTDPEMTPRAVIERFTGRWSIDKAHPDSTSSLGWSRIRVSDYNPRRRVA